jgi:predicted lipase
MVKIKRRQILLGGVAAGVAATVGTEYKVRSEKQAQEAQFRALAAKDPNAILKHTFEADTKKIKEGAAIQASVPLTRPTIPYSREMSLLLIQCSKLATQQYLTGKTIPTYDGSIKSLPAYFSELDGYTHLASFRGHEAKVEEKVEVEVPTGAQNQTQDPLEQQASEAKDVIGKTVQETVKFKQVIPVYLGFVLTSKTKNIIVFRGTQRVEEWLYNFYARQREYRTPGSGEYFGKIHKGFIENYDSIIDPIPREIAKKLDPSVPCYITGHSLGAALAVIASVDLASNIPALKPQIQLYTYAGSRVGNPTFAQVHTKYIPNHYRVVNLADVVPLLPPLQSPGGEYVHTGEEWSFLSQSGDFLPNHVVDTYHQAVAQGVETNQSRLYPLSGLA